jgi:Pyruvate/2-oxoacid:ferredoxin oxidoreductase delta subunit
MKKLRKIIEIDEDKCTGCGDCIVACAEGALALVDGKARMIGDIYCDGLGACIGECPEDALRIIEREAEDFDEEAVAELLEKKKIEEPANQPQEETMACGCPGTMARSIDRSESGAADASVGELPSQLGHWPIKLQLLGPQTPFLKGSDLVLMADCTGFSFPNLHRQMLRGRTIAIGCPKLDDLDAHITRLAEILKGAEPGSLTVIHMEVPCCRGFVYTAEKALEMSGVDIPLRRIMIGVKGELLEEEDMHVPAIAEAGRQG